MKTYQGDPVSRTIYVTDERGERRRLSPQRSQKIWNHSPDGFNWGYGGSGPAQLALALLLDHGIHGQEVISMYQRFKTAVIANQKIDQEFILTSDQINEWIVEWRNKKQN